MECGTAKGFCAKTILEYTKTKKKFFLLDKWDGLEKYCDRYVDFAEIEETFSRYPNVNLAKGTIPETLKHVNTDKIAFIHMDLNSAEPEMAAINYFWDKLVPNAIIVLDDYGHPGFEEQRYAWDRFAQEKNVNILCLPTGQGLILK